MSLAEKLGGIYNELDNALDNANNAIVAKGGSRASDIYDIGNKITNIKMRDWSLQKVVSNDSIPYTITLPKGSEENDSLIYPIRDYAFYCCSGLTSITLPEKISSIGNYAFYYCSNLTSITNLNILAGSIGNYAFCYCSNLTSITISKVSRTIGNSAFYECTNLANIYFNQPNPPTLNHTNAFPSTTIIHVPVGSGEAYRNATNWSYHSARIVEDIVIESATE